MVKGNDKTVRFSLMLKKEHNEKLEILSDKIGVSKSAIVIMALNEYFKDKESMINEN